MRGTSAPRVPGSHASRHTGLVKGGKTLFGKLHTPYLLSDSLNSWTAGPRHCYAVYTYAPNPAYGRPPEMPARCPVLADEIEYTQALLAHLCIQLEGADPNAAIALLRGKQSVLEQAINASRTHPRLLRLPPEVIAIVLRWILFLSDGAARAFASLLQTCKFFSSGNGMVLLLEQCAELCPGLASTFSGQGLIEYMGVLLEIQQLRFDGDMPRFGSGLHTAFVDAPELGKALVTLEALEARDVLSPCGFVVGEPSVYTAHEHFRVCGLLHVPCAVPGLPGTLHDGALHECNLFFCVDDGDVPTSTRGHIYPWAPPEVFIGGQTEPYHAMLTPNTSLSGVGHLASRSPYSPLREPWDGSFCLGEILLHVQDLIHSHNLYQPVQEQPCLDATNDTPLFRERVRAWALSTQAGARLPDPPQELVRAVLERQHLDPELMQHLRENMEEEELEEKYGRYDSHGNALVRLGGRVTWRIFGHQGFWPYTTTCDVVDGELAPLSPGAKPHTFPNLSA